MITRLKLNSFCAFKELEIEFSPKINVIIGENGSGKTQLLKAAYVLTRSGEELGGRKSVMKADAQSVLTQKMLGVYKPEDNKIGALRYRGDKSNTTLTVEFSSGQSLGASFTSRSNKVVPLGNYKKPDTGGGVFLPTKEILSFLGGIADPESHRPTVEQLFDTTYFDLAHKLLNPKQAREEKAQWSKEKITNKIGGRFEFNGSKVSFRPGGYKEYKKQHASKTYFAPIAKDCFSTTMTAEGYRKLGVLQRLLQNSAVGTGASGPLYWDEPESNMNPQLLSTVVEVLLELSRNGQQIILATHDYILLKWFDLLLDKKGKSDHVKFHTLFRDGSGKIDCESSDSYKQLSKNAIALTYSELYDAEIERALGRPGV